MAEILDTGVEIVTVADPNNGEYVAGNDYIYQITDKNGKMLFSIDDKGFTHFNQPPTYYNNKIAVFDCVADMKESCGIFDMAITKGFYEPNDGGGGAYYIEDHINTTTTKRNEYGQLNYSIFSLPNNRYAKLIYGNCVYVDQLGMKRNDSDYNLADYVNVIISYMKVYDVRLYEGIYWQKRPMVFQSTNSIHLSGYENFAPNQGATEIYYTSTRTDAGASVFSFEARNIVVENLRIVNKDYDDPTKPGRICLYCYLYSGTNIGHYGYKFRRLQIVNFDRGIHLDGKVKWDCFIEDVRVQNCRIGCYLHGSYNLLMKFDLFYTDHCTEAGIVIEEAGYDVHFVHCNFGAYGGSSVDIRGASHVRWKTNALFESCNFETDGMLNPNTIGTLVKTGDNHNISLAFKNCTFNTSRLLDEENCTAMAFGEYTSASFENCIFFDCGIDSDGNIPEVWYHFFDKTHLPQKVPGSISFMGINLEAHEPDYPEEYIPCIRNFGIFGYGPTAEGYDNTEAGSGVIKCKTVEMYNDYLPYTAVGTMVYIIDEDAMYMKSANGNLVRL